MDNEEGLVYKAIKATGNQGIWVKTIKTQTNLHEQVVQRCIKSLEQKALIKSVKSVKSTKKMYMLMELNPSTELTGGTWFSDQELDVEFVETLAEQCYKYILSKSFPEDKNDKTPIYSSSYQGYATVTSVRSFIVDYKITTVELTFDNIEELLNMLILEDRIEKVAPVLEVSGNRNGLSSQKLNGDWYYRAVRSQQTNDPEWYIDTPCVQCPIYETCYVKSEKISPKVCVYLNYWLDY